MPASSFTAQSYRCDGVVLRTHKLGEADRIITLLTPDHGLVRAVAKGVRRTSSRFGARLEPYMVNDLQLVPRRSLDIITQAESRFSYGQAISAHYAKYTVAAAMAEVSEKLTEVDADSTAPHYRLVVGALGSLARGEHAPALVLGSYLLRALAIAGWAANFSTCARCDAEGPHESISVVLGGAVCVNCRPPGSTSATAETLALLAALLAGEWDVADMASEGSARSALAVVVSFTQWHLERSIRSLKLVEGIV